ncbi:MAG: hypothetical protein GWP91_14725, partial [Rhodobacterales bacterium]|nr:hypothetical protein [Rhodobacterales bacterium]
MRTIPLLLALSLTSPSALASGYYYSDSGIVATGRGGAWVAGADTQFAQHYNPAGLIRVKAPTFNIGWSGIQQNVHWTQANPDGGFYPEASGNAPPFSVPQFGFVTPVGDKVAIAIGFISPFAPSSNWNPKGPQRYSIIESSVYQFGFGPSVAYQPIKALTFGFGAQASYLALGRSFNLTLSGLEDPSGDVFIEARAKDTFTPTFNLGLLIEPVQQVAFGFSLTAPATYNAKGQIGVNFDGSSIASLLSETELEDPNVGVQITLPTIIRAGMAVRPNEKLEVEITWVHQAWASLEEIIIDDIDLAVEVEALNQSTPIPEQFELPAGLQNASSIRLGGEYRINDGLELRAGGFYGSTAVPEELVTVSLVDTAKVQLGTGASIWFLDGKLRFDGAAAVVLHKTLEVRDSQVEQLYIYPGIGAEAEPSVIGN